MRFENLGSWKIKYSFDKNGFLPINVDIIIPKFMYKSGNPLKHFISGLSSSLKPSLKHKSQDKASTMKVFVVLFFIVAVSANFESRIAGGIKAKAGKITSFVALQIEFDSGIKGCGGLLSSANQVITAANCVFR